MIINGKNQVPFFHYRNQTTHNKARTIHDHDCNLHMVPGRN